jgi:hypothetical protein
MGRDCIRNIRKALFDAQTVLDGRTPNANQRIGTEVQIGPSGKSPSQFDRLIVAALQEPRPMDRHRYDQGLPSQNGSAGMRKPNRGWSGQVGPVAMFQRKNEPAARTAIRKYRATFFPGTRGNQTFIAKDVRPVVVSRKRSPAPVAYEAPQEGHIAPA